MKRWKGKKEKREEKKINIGRKRQKRDMN